MKLDRRDTGRALPAEVVQRGDLRVGRRGVEADGEEENAPVLDAARTRADVYEGAGVLEGDGKFKGARVVLR